MRARARTSRPFRLLPMIVFDPDTDALFLDLDGTLIDIALRPDDVYAPDSLIFALEALYRRMGGALAIVSGRSIAAVDTLLSPLRLPAAGVHGAEIRIDPRGHIRHGAPLLPTAVRWLLAPLLNIHGVLIEDKGVAIAVHYRQAPESAEVIRDVVMAAVRANSAEGLTVIPGKFVFEIKHANLSKGTAVAEFMAHAPWARRRPVFIGDDVTDEAGFAVLPRWSGLGLSVGQQRPGAVIGFQTADEVRTWLTQLVQQECTT